MTLTIEDYALIGDCETAALVGRNGSIDWLCLPRFDSEACFAAILGDHDTGRWLIAPTDPQAKVSRRYRPDTLILETRFETESGAATLIDFMYPCEHHPHLVRLDGERALGAEVLAAQRDAGLQNDLVGTGDGAQALVR